MEFHVQDWENAEEIETRIVRTEAEVGTFVSEMIEYFVKSANRIVK